MLNGIEVSQASNLVNSMIPGLTFTILGESTEPVTLTLATSRSKIAASLQSFVTAFNSLRAQLTAQIGKGAGLLSGHVLIRQLQSELRAIAGFRAAGSDLHGLAELGINFDGTGQASFDQAAFDRLPDARLGEAFDFLGASGLGEYATRLKQFSDPISGLIRAEQDGLDRVDRALQAQMESITQRIEVMRAGLARKLQQADTLLAALASQQTTIKATLQGLNSVLYGRKDEQ